MSTESNDANLGLYYGWDYSEDGWNTGMDRNMLILGGMASLSVKSRSTTVAPSSPTDGDVYYIPSSAIGTWSAYLKNIAIYSSFEADWLYISVKNGWQFRVADETGTDGLMLSVFYDGTDLIESIDLTGYVKETSSYTATGTIDFSGKITYSGTHSADTSELATIQDIDDAVAGQDFNNVATLSGDNTFTGNNSFTEEVTGIDATSDSSLTTKSQMDSAISAIAIDNTSGGDAGVYQGKTGNQFDLRSFTSIDNSVVFDDLTNNDYVDLSINFPSGGADNFIGLNDTPTDYESSDAGKLLAVNTNYDAIEFVDNVGYIEIYDEGSLIGEVSKINFIGSDVGAYLNGDTVDIYIPDVNFTYSSTSVDPNEFIRGQDMTGQTVDIVWELTPSSATLTSNTVTSANLTFGIPTDNGNNNYSLTNVDVSSLDSSAVNSDETIYFNADSASFGSASASETIEFVNFIYYGRSKEATLTEIEVEALSDFLTTNDHTTTYSFDANSGVDQTYLYICYPTRLGELTTWDDGSQFGVVTLTPVAIISVTNTQASPYTEDYYIQRSVNTLAAAYSVTTS